MQYRIAPAAKADLAEIWDYLAGTASIEVADKVADDIEQAILRIAEMPGIGHFREGMVPDDHKVYVVFKYSIIYSYNATPIIISRILHGARDIGKMISGN